MPTKRHKAPEPIGAALQPLLDRIDREGHFAIVRLAKAWPEIVGETIARRTEIVSLKCGKSVRRDVDTGTQSDEVAVTRTRHGADWR
jgi:hypothetical protein